MSYRCLEFVCLEGVSIEVGVVDVVIDRCCTALFSVFDRLTVLLSHVILNEGLYFFYSALLNIHPSGVLAALFGSYMTGATRNCCHHSARSVYTIQPCTIHVHFMCMRV